MALALLAHTPRVQLSDYNVSASWHTCALLLLLVIIIVIIVVVDIIIIINMSISLLVLL